MEQENERITQEQIRDTVVEAAKEVESTKIVRTQNTTTVDLPSNGLMNKNITRVTLRKMSVMEMKTLHTSMDPNYLSNLILSVITEPSNITLEDLHPNDVIYLLFVLRYISSPKNITQLAECPTCKRGIEFQVSVQELDVNYSKEDDNEFSVTLPECGDKLTFKILSEGSIIDTERIAQRKAKQQNLSEEDTAWSLILAKTSYWLMTKNDLDFEKFNDKLEYISSLSAYDFETLRVAYAKEVEKFGLDRKIITTCDNCKDEIEVEAYISPDFFRLV